MATSCILAGNAKNCKFSSLMEVCSRCETLSLEEELCIQFGAECMHISSYQAPSQCKAHKLVPMTLRIRATDCMVLDYSISVKIAFLYKVKLMVGTGTMGCCDGPAAKEQLSEPTGLCFDFGTAIFSCFGGSRNGYTKICTADNFACNFIAKLREIYHAIGFLPKKEQNHLAQLGKNPSSPYGEGTNKLINSLAYLKKQVLAKWKEHLKMATASPEGTVYHASVQGFAETVKGIEAHIQSLELLEENDVLDK